MPLLSSKRTILAKLETAYGSDASPATANSILVRNLDVTALNSEVVGRDLVRGYFGASEQVIASTNVQVTFEVEMAGAGAAGTIPKYGVLLRACGMSESVSAGVKVSYAPVSSGIESATIYFNVDGVLHKVIGSRGNVELVMNAGEIPVYRFTFTGKYVAPTDAVLPTVDYSGFQTPLAINDVNTDFSFFSYAAPMESLSVNVGNTVIYRNLVNSETVIISDRQASGTVTFEAPNIATKDFFTIATGRTNGTLDVTHGTAVGNKVRMVSSRTDITNVTYADSDGIHMLNVPFTLVPTAAGNDFAIEVL